ncbi:MAG TPA: hypothetical protein DCQ31_14225 [Bacteroidales bacterium]|nr:hypothetical protein [Bacteroidales bacterium]
MNFYRIINKRNLSELAILKNYRSFRSSVYGRVVFIIFIMSLFLFLSFGLIFKSVNEEYINTVICENGDNIGSIVEGALYRSMLENDKSALQNTLDIINTMSGIDNVNMYDSNDSLVYSSYKPDAANQSDANCISCHENLKTMFPGEEKSYTILDLKSDCEMNSNNSTHRYLLIKSPIVNQPSCYTSSCHAHSETDRILGSLIIKLPLTKLDAAVEKFTAEFFLIGTLTTVLLVFLLILFTGRKIRNPLKDIIRVSQAVANGDTSKRLEIKPKQLDDIKMVSVAINNMLDKLNNATIELQNWSQQLEYKVQIKSEELMEAQNELIHVERIASLGKLSSSVAHELNNPLSGVLTYTKLVHKQLSKQTFESEAKESMLKNLKIIETETKRCGDIVKGLLDFSRKDRQDFESQHLNQVLKETYDLMLHQMKISNISFLNDFNAQFDVIYCSPNQIKQACVAMLVNSLEAIGENGEIIIRTTNPTADTVKILISDNGTGIAPDDISHIFEPFFSAKNKASGIGLGLAIVFGIIQNHKGEIEVKSELGKGTAISITLPLHKA